MASSVRTIETKVDFDALCALFQNEPYCAILDSSLVSTENRFTIIGYSPYCILEDKGGKVYENGQEIGEDFIEALSRLWHQGAQGNPTHLPLISGAIGYFSYDFGRRFENIPSRHTPTSYLPDALFCFYEHYIIFDHITGECHITAQGTHSEPGARLDELERRILCTSGLATTSHPSPRNGTPPTAPLVARTEQTKNQHPSQPHFSFDFTREEYCDAVRSVIDRIYEGDVYIANLTQRMYVHSTIEPYELFCRLCRQNPSPFGAFLRYGDSCIVSASPERFIRIKGKDIETKPIKGTRPRGKNKTEDKQLRAQLETSEKDHSELMMIVDLERNDLNRVCEAGSVQVRNLFGIEEYATVFHLVSTICGRLTERATMDDVARAVFPGGSITGAPKIEAMSVIDELEHSPRGLYTGSLGYISSNGDCDFNIMIRTAIYNSGTYEIGVGGGITCESDPEGEYEETLDKARAFIDIFRSYDA